MSFGQSRFGLGEATGNSTASLRIPGTFIEGWTVQLTVAPKMGMSSYAVWNR